MNQTLLIFARNLLWGRVKTRLAATAGNAVAYRVYEQLLQHTQGVCRGLPFRKTVYYSDFVAEEDGWEEGYEKKLQEGADLGARMEQAFANSWRGGAAATVIIGTDCLQLSQAHLAEAFDQLHQHDVVLGPATDGGYYLLGMNEMHEGLFRGISWSTGTVLAETLEKCRSLGLTFHLLPKLSDIDTEEDWLRAGPVFQKWSP